MSYQDPSQWRVQPMKNIISIFILMFIIASAMSVAQDRAKPSGSSKSPKAKIESIYTDLVAEKCKTIESDDSGAGSYEGECPGVGGYALHVLEGDIRQTINLVQKSSGNVWELDLWSVVSGAFSSVGEKAEWRVKRVRGNAVPIALIVRFNASEDVENSENVTSRLVVAKIAGESICVTDIVEPVKNANEIARKLADASASKPCKERRN